MVEITNENGIEAIVSDPSIEADVVNLNELDIRVSKKEYTIVGDGIYIPKLYDDAPEWMKNLVQIVVDVSLETGNVDLINQLNSVLSEFATQYVPLNQYTQSILDLSNEDARINAVIETLNSNYNDGISEANAQIIGLQLTKASKTEVVAQVLQTISAELQNGESDLGAVVARLDQAIADESSARAMSFETVMASMESLDGTVSGEASATSNLYAYVGYERDGSSTGTGLLADVQILQKQNDGVIETVTGTYDVMVNPQDPNLAELVLTAEPYASWKAQDVNGVDTRLAHIGDVYIKYGITSNGAREYIASFKFIRTVVDASDTHKSTDADGFTWALIVDQAAQDAYNQALNAYDLADNKRRVFVSTPYVPYDIGDLWLVQAGAAIIGTTQGGRVIQVGDVLRCSEAKTATGLYENSDWTPADNYRESMEAIKSNLQGQIDGKVDTYYQGTVPIGMTALNNGDYWYCTADISTYKKGKVYKYVHASTLWVETADVSRYAFDVADGKAAIFSSTNLPTSGYKINDMLIVVGSFNNGTTTFADGVVLSSNATRTSGFTPADWVKKINDTEDLDAFVSGTYTPAVASLQSQVDGQISYYFFDSSLGQSAASVSGSSSWTTDALKKEHNGDIAYDTKLELGYWYDRSVSNWVQITGAQNAGIIEALKKAAEAKEAADSVIVSYYAWKQTTAPATQYKWMKDDNTLWEYVGSSWAVVDVKKDDTLTAYNNTTKDTTLYVHNGSVWTMITPNGIVANSKAVTDLNASLSSLGTTVSGHTSLLNTVDARIGSEGARVETKFAYNSMLMINGASYSSGFGIATSLTSGSGLSTGQSEFWIKADKFKLMSADGSKKSSYSPFTVDSVTGEINFNGKVTFSNVTGASSSANMLYNSAPAIGLETKGWHADYNDTGLTSSGLLATGDPYRPTGYGAFHQYINGTPAVGKVFDIRTDGKIPVIGGQYYEASAYLNTHRCNGQIYIEWRDASDAVITWSFGMEMPQTNAQGSLANWGRVSIIEQAPANATSCYFYIRGISTGEANPHVFVSMCYFGRASENQTVISNWSEGISAGVSSNEVVSAINSGQTTTIDGGKITTGSITANQINVNNLFAQDITYTGVITGGNVAGGGIIKSYNNNMVIDLVNGSIYIA